MAERPFREMGPWRRWFLAGAGVAVSLLALPALESSGSLSAQANPWQVEGEVGGSVFWGNRAQTQLASRLEFERADSLYESSTEFRFTYGEAEGSDGIKQVNRRSWLAASQLDFRPEERLRPFVSGRVESALERRIDLRYNAGAGMKLEFQRDRNNRVDLSAAILAERTYARDVAGVESDDVSLARWSSSMRVRRTFFEDRLSMDSDNAYQPVFDSFGNFTFRSRNAVSFGLSQSVALRTTYLTEYDSGAKDRGARTNSDGQVQMSIVVRF